MIKKMSNEDIITAVNRLTNFKRSKNKNPVKLMYLINRNLEHLRSASKPFEDSRKEILSKYCDVKGGKVVPHEGEKEIAESELKELLEIEIDIDIYQLPLKDIEGMALSGDEFDAIDFMIE